MRPMDHIVIAVRYLEEAASFWGKRGVQGGARNRHPHAAFGTEILFEPE